MGTGTGMLIFVLSGLLTGVILGYGDLIGSLAGRLHVPASNDAVGVTPRRRRRRGKGLPGICELA